MSVPTDRPGYSKMASVRNDTRKRGWLHKKSSSGGPLGFSLLSNWKKRYFVFEDGVNLDYYVDETQAVSKGTYTINAHCVVKIVFEEAPTPFTFTLEDTKRKVTHLMAAESEEERARWIAMIFDAVYSLKNFSSVDAFNPATGTSSQSDKAAVEAVASEPATKHEAVAPVQAVAASGQQNSDDDDDDRDSDDEDVDSDNESGGEDGGGVVKKKLLKGQGGGTGAAVTGKFSVAKGEAVGFNSAGILTGGAWTRGPIVLRAGGGTGGGGGGDSDAPRYASDTIAVLNAQLVAEGKRPLEFLPLKTIKNELARIFEKVNAGEDYDEGRMDHLLKCMEFNPEYKREKEEEAQRWRSTTVAFSKECLEIMRGYVPTCVFSSSLTGLHEMGLSKDLAKRIYTKKCLWLVRMRTEDLMKLHEADLLGKFGCEALQLDVVELCAIYAIAPTKFTVDPSGRKEIWRSSLEAQVRKMLAAKEADKLPKNQLRAITYKNQPPLFTEDRGWKVDNRVTGDAFGKQDDFRKICQEAADVAGSEVEAEAPAGSPSARPVSVPPPSRNSSADVESPAERPARPMSMQRPNPTDGTGLTLMQQLAMRKKVGADPDEATGRPTPAAAPAPGKLMHMPPAGARPNPFGGPAPEGGLTLMQQIAMRNKNKEDAEAAAAEAAAPAPEGGLTLMQQIAMRNKNKEEPTAAPSPAASLFASVGEPASKPAGTPPARPQLSFMDQIKKRQQLE
jgi:hypothetical protein